MHDPARYRPTERFGDRVADYARARPGYPPAVTDWLIAEAQPAPGAIAADLGSGTGLFTRELLAAGLRVYGVEPNATMRAEAERSLAPWAAFTSRAGTAEATGLAPASVDLVTAAQAFHWFEPRAARAEARRILKPQGCAALIWNVRRLDSAFSQDYEALLLKHCRDYTEGQPHQAAAQDIEAFFGESTRRRASFEHAQRFDFAHLQARLLSSSYTPKEDDPARAPLLAALRELFERHQRAGGVCFDYDTQVHLGRP
ncbi:MAG: class I SAM-dependent methyltransferase [Nevskia sp.]